MALVWIDLETTGLDPEKCVVLEVACIVTDDALNELGRFESVTTEAKHTELSKVDPYVLKMHADNGLWNASLLAPEWDVFDHKNPDPVTGEVAFKQHGCRLAAVDGRLAEFIAAHCPELGEKKGPQLAGSTISFDRAFMKKHLYGTHACLHYRNVDVTSFNETARRFFPELHENRPRGGDKAAHRGMADILESIAVYKHYVREFTTALKIADLVMPTSDLAQDCPAGPRHE